MSQAIIPSRLPVLRLPGGTESYSRRVGQADFRIDTIANITCAHALVPSQGQALDATGTQTDIARAIRDGGGDYCMSLKKNWPAMYADVEQLFNEPPENP